ncbi:hypothetical protein [Companilactobacillus ginsenosidimutans]|uniref:HicB-like antitoxin of toxin-antitoxin system domain-containing protein n=1 Tax=Companilactobacillus ginsenosidimutans TaxID=1007676 RepID=A0A0H4QEK6_9LACO|nr:hypothetical protein [Companilactobacillus ginsenosidimutans]AKP66819.1 hypothetical protein ABM34_04045 [Companilactobacillus ginsenosidimutans]
MKAVYPIIMRNCKRNYYPYFIDIPDFDISLHAEDPYSGMQAARHRIVDEIDMLAENGKNIPRSNYIIPTSYQADIITLVDVDTNEFYNEKFEHENERHLSYN